MSYRTQAQAAQDQNLRLRCIACAATERIPQALNWVDQHMWELATQPNWGNAYASALANGDPAPGNNEAVITDGMILSAVQAIHTA